MCELLEKISSDPVASRGRDKKREPTPSISATTSQGVAKRIQTEHLEESEDISDQDDPDYKDENNNNNSSISSTDTESSPLVLQEKIVKKEPSPGKLTTSQANIIETEQLEQSKEVSDHNDSSTSSNESEPATVGKKNQKKKLKKKETSAVWLYFNKTTTNNIMYAVCNVQVEDLICGRKYVHSSSTSTLRRHLLNNHKTLGKLLIKLLKHFCLTKYTIILKA